MALPAALLLMLATAGCDGGNEAAAPRPEPVRSVKTAVAVPARGGDREFAGTVRAAERASLGFPLPGKVATIEVEVGDLVRRGQVLARLDPVPLELRLRQAQADLDRARAALSAERRRFEAQQTLLAKGFTTRRAFDQAQADLAAAEMTPDVVRGVRKFPGVDQL
jgi:multidrug efflux pump subunit AcrA (membrane-fusion protein)